MTLRHLYLYSCPYMFKLSKESEDENRTINATVLQKPYYSY